MPPSRNITDVIRTVRPASEEKRVWAMDILPRAQVGGQPGISPSPLSMSLTSARVASAIGRIRSEEVQRVRVVRHPGRAYAVE